MTLLNLILHGRGKSTSLYICHIKPMVLLWNRTHIMFILQGIFCTCQKDLLHHNILLTSSLFHECHNSLAKYWVVLYMLLIFNKNRFFSSVFTSSFLKHIFFNIFCWFLWKIKSTLRIFTKYSGFRSPTIDTKI